MRIDTLSKRLTVIACALVAGLAVGFPFRASEAQVNDNSDELAQVREALTSSPPDALMFLVVKPEGGDTTRIWYFIQGKASDPESNVWSNVIVKNESKMLIGIGKDNVAAFATPVPSGISAENLKSLVDEWRMN